MATKGEKNRYRITVLGASKGGCGWCDRMFRNAKRFRSKDKVTVRKRTLKQDSKTRAVPITVVEDRKTNKKVVIKGYDDSEEIKEALDDLGRYKKPKKKNNGRKFK